MFHYAFDVYVDALYNAQCATHTNLFILQRIIHMYCNVYVCSIYILHYNIR